ncbi:MAG: outer membrane protein assembly factor BamE [Clostridia bacterium]|nr:outer membrane protein assembly factor BamE [Clostridia bacterium]
MNRCPNYATDFESRVSQSRRLPVAFVKQKKSASKESPIPFVVETLVLFALLIILPFAIHFNIFRAGKVLKIEIGDSAAQVENLLGDPAYRSPDRRTWYYASGKAKEVYQSLDQNPEVSSILEDATFSFIKISFSEDGTVSEVYLDKNHTFDLLNTSGSKTVKEIRVSLNDYSTERFSVDGRTGGVGLEQNADGSYSVMGLENTVYSVKFTDGSFYRGIIGSANATVSEDRATCALSWSDDVGSYSGIFPVVLENAGTLHTHSDRAVNDFFSIDLFWFGIAGCVFVLAYAGSYLAGKAKEQKKQLDLLLK